MTGTIIRSFEKFSAMIGSLVHPLRKGCWINIKSIDVCCMHSYRKNDVQLDILAEKIKLSSAARFGGRKIDSEKDS